MKIWIWAIRSALGLGLMIETYQRFMRGDPHAPWAQGLLCIGEGEPVEPLEVGTHFSTRLRLLPARPTTELILKNMGGEKPQSKAALEAQLRPKLIEIPIPELGQLVGWLRDGRMPEPGENEVLAGSECSTLEPLIVAGTTLKVVGSLQPSVGLFANSYLAPVHPALDRPFTGANGDVREVKIVDMGLRKDGDQKAIARLTEAFPAPAFTIVG